MNHQTNQLAELPAYAPLTALSLQKIFDATPDLICTVDAEGCFVTTNKAALSFWQYYPYQLSGIKYIDMVVEEDKSKTIRAARAAMQGAPITHLTNRLYRKDGTIITLSWSAAWCAEEALFYGTARDITECRKYALTEEQRFRSLIEHGSDMTGIIDAGGNYNYISDNAKTILGYRPRDLSGKNIFDFIHPGDAPAIYEQLAKIAIEKYIEVKPFRFKNASGEWRYIETKATNLTDNPAIGGIVINSRDVTERKAIEDQLHMLSLMVEQTKNSVVITDVQQRIIWVNAAFEQVTGYTLAEVAGKRPFSFFKIEAEERALQKIQAAYRDKKPVSATFASYSKSGKKYWVESLCNRCLTKREK